MKIFMIYVNGCNTIPLGTKDAHFERSKSVDNGNIALHLERVNSSKQKLF